MCVVVTLITHSAVWSEQALSETAECVINSNRVWLLFKRLLKVAGLPEVRFHDLRHGAAKVLLAAKVDVKVVSEMLGHSSVAITADIHARALPEMQQEVVRKRDELFGRS